MTFSSRKLQDRPVTTGAGRDFNEAVDQFLELVRGTPTYVHYGATVRHFTHWLHMQGIPLSEVGLSTVDRFAKHECSCHRYRPGPLRNREYIGRVRRFVRYLEDQGYVSVPTELAGLSAHLSSYKEHLASLGYEASGRRVLYSGAEHFAVWLRVSRLSWNDINEDAVDQFVIHNCRCGHWRKAGELATTGRQKRRRGAQRSQMDPCSILHRLGSPEKGGQAGKAECRFPLYDPYTNPRPREE